jgi:hypothetical protein
LSRSFPTNLRIVRGATEFERLCHAWGCSDAIEASARNFGEPITDRRTSWVRRRRDAAGDFFIKTYDYPGIAAPLAGWLRNTGPFRPSRPSREAAALNWLAAQDIPATRAVAVLEWRSFGCLRRATLVTEAWSDQSLDCLLPRLSPAERTVLAAELRAFVDRLHRLGFRDRNLDLRNLLARRRPDGTFELTKIDSPRFLLVRPGARGDRLVAAVWARLRPQLAAFGLATAATGPADPSGRAT